MRLLMILLLVSVFSGHADIVVVHGMLSSSDVWKDFGDKVARETGRTVVYYEYRHLGKFNQVLTAATGGSDYHGEYTRLSAERLRLRDKLAKATLAEAPSIKMALAHLDNVIALPEAVVNEEASLVKFLSDHKGNNLDVVAHSLGSSLLLNAMAHATSCGGKPPYVNVVVFLGSNMNQGNFTSLFITAKASFGRIYNVYTGNDRGCSWAFGSNLGKNGMWKAEGLSAMAQQQILNIDSGLKSDGFSPLAGAHGRYSELPVFVSALIKTPLMCRKDSPYPLASATTPTQLSQVNSAESRQRAQRLMTLLDNDLAFFRSFVMSSIVSTNVAKHLNASNFAKSSANYSQVIAYRTHVADVDREIRLYRSSLPPTDISGIEQKSRLVTAVQKDLLCLIRGEQPPARSTEVGRFYQQAFSQKLSGQPAQSNFQQLR